MIAMIAAVAKNGVIGRDNAIPWHIPEDLAHFRRITMGGTLIMGRRTFGSIGRPLPGRRTIVVSRTLPPVPGIRIAGSLAEAVAMAGEGEVFLCGGERIYAEGMALAGRIYLTELEAAYAGDAFFPPMTGFVLRERQPSGTPGCSFCIYDRE